MPFYVAQTILLVPLHTLCAVESLQSVWCEIPILRHSREHLQAHRHLFVQVMHRYWYLMLNGFYMAEGVGYVKLSICKGTGHIELLLVQCLCNGTGEHTKCSRGFSCITYVQCILLERHVLYVEKCHHDVSKGYGWTCLEWWKRNLGS